MTNRVEIGAFIMRAVIGTIFFVHGVQKFQGGIGNTADWFSSIGLPGFFAYLVGGLEVVGGLALLIGLATRIIAGLFALMLLGAIITVQFSVGFLGGFEYDLALLSITVFLILNDSTLYSVDRLIGFSR